MPGLPKKEGAHLLFLIGIILASYHLHMPRKHQVYLSEPRAKNNKAV
ncbi:hypothetical protein CHCC20335_0609 [Bacillus paralicheniformis]|nr:hypothetical protein CHCC20335_0609 [Bacillus paralicheniformis]